MPRVVFGFIGFMTAVSAMAQDVPDTEAKASADVAAITEQFNIDRSDRMTVQVRVNGSTAVPFIVDVDDGFGTQARRLRATISTDDLDFFSVQEQDVFDTLALLNGGQTVGYSHRGEGRLPIPLVVERDKADRVMDERFLTTPIPATGGKGRPRPFGAALARTRTGSLTRIGSRGSTAGTGFSCADAG